MSETLEPYLKVENNDNICLICSKELGNDVSLISKDLKAWTSLKNHALDWKSIPLQPGEEYYGFTLLYDKIDGIQEPFGKRHRSFQCKGNFAKVSLRDKLKQSKAVSEQLVDASNISDNPGDTEPSSSTRRTRSSTGNTTQFARICFICNHVRPCDDNKYIEGGLGVCEFVSAAEKLENASNSMDEKHHFYPAKLRLDLLISGQCKDIYSAEIRYHRSCYSNFVKVQSPEDEKIALTQELHKNTLNEYLSKLEFSIVQQKNAYLLSDLLRDWMTFCEDRQLDSTITQSHKLKEIVLERFPDSIGFFRSGKYLIVHSQYINPCEYSVSTLKGHGMRDTDIIRSFANLIRRRVESKRDEEHTSFPMKPNELVEELHKGPIPELYNAIYMTLNGSGAINKHGYCGTNSSNLANKIWALASDWEALLLRRPTYRNPKQVLLAVVLYRIARSKALLTFVNKSNNCISYKDTLTILKYWEDMVMKGESSTVKLIKKAVTHSSIDNIDDETESISLHFTNSNIFQPNISAEKATTESINVEKNHPGTIEELSEVLIEKRKGPPLMPGYIDCKSTDLLDQRFSIDILWSVLGSLPIVDGKENPPIGPWTHFMKQITGKSFEPMTLQYLPVIPQPVHDYAVLKAYLVFLNETTENLEIKHIFAHADEAVVSKLLELIWVNGDEFKKVIPLMGGFHQLMNLQKIMYKRYACLGLDKWINTAKTTKSMSSAEKAIHGKHYNTTTRVYKEIFDAILELRVEDVTSNFVNIDGDLLDALVNTREQVNAANVNHVLEMSQFQHFQKQLLTLTGTQSQMTVMLLKDISLMLSFIVSARESDIELHHQCERQFLNLANAFDHVHYTRWGSFQHVKLQEMKRLNTDAYIDLKTTGWTASQTGGKFNAVHGDYICERQNAATKSSGGPIKSGVGGSTTAFNTWLRTRHIGVELQSELKKVLKIKTSSQSKDSTASGIRKHRNNVLSLKGVIRDAYKYDFFSDGEARVISTGREISSDVVSGLLNSAKRGDERFQSFVEARLKTGTVSFFAKIPKMKIQTGIKKQPKPSKPIDVLKEDAQGFGILAQQIWPLKVAFQSPVTKWPTSIAESATDLRGATTNSKSKFRNALLQATKSVSNSYPQNACWIFDGGRFIRSASPEKTYRKFFDILISKMSPPVGAHATSVHILLDKYIAKSTKAGARKVRGEDQSTRLYITGFDQEMPRSDDWSMALSNSDTKRSLLSTFCAYVLSGEAPLVYPTFINDVDQTWKIDPLSKQVTKLFVCNHEEADTRMIYHASIQDSPVVISANDSDVFVLGTYACALDKTRQWYFNYQTNCYSDLRKVADTLGEAALYLPQFHALTGCDTTAYFYFRGKTQPWERAVKASGGLTLISKLGATENLSDEDMGDIIEFVRRFVYCGREGEDLIETKVRMYEDQKVKRSSTLPPDLNSLTHDVLRKHHQAYTWMRCLEPNVETLPLENFGWKERDGLIVPVWYTCPQLPTVSRKRKERAASATCKPKKMKVNEGSGSQTTQEVNKELSEPQEEIIEKEQITPIDILPHPDEEDDVSDDDEDEWEHLSEFSNDSSSDDSDWEL